MNTITQNGWQARIHRLLASAVIASALSCASAGTAAAQAGSAGGTIGKSDKSISGSEKVVPRPARHQKQERNKREPASGRSSQASCRSIVGTWASWASGVYGKQDTKIRADGTIEHRTSKGTWSCTAGEYIHVWDAFGVRGPYTLSPDGKRLIKIKDGSVSFSRN
jgi:uncharacterized cupin superfamily protein